MRILQVSTLDRGGGAEQVAWNLHQAYRARGHDAWLAVGRKQSPDDRVLHIGQPSLPPIGQFTLPRRGSWTWWCQGLSNRLQPWDGRLRGVGRVRHYLRDLADGWEGLGRRVGLEDFHHPASRALISLPPERPDIVQAHNLHGRYFDLRYLAPLSRQVPVLLTLHDAWLLSGNCAHSLACDRWLNGCGQCPDIGIYPGLPRDATTWNWRRKRAIYARSRVYVATPCQWLADKVTRSILAPAIIDSRVIPNGVNTSVFKPADRRMARRALQLPEDPPILLFTANGIRNNIFKDYQTLRAAIRQVAEGCNNHILLIALGESGEEERIGQVRIQFVAHTPDPTVVARYYQAADLYLHAARAETFPNTILEALACGTPVIAAAVGGIPEQIEPGVTGTLVPPGDSQALAGAIGALLDDPVRRASMSAAAADIARSRFSLDMQTNRYLDWYGGILDMSQRHLESVPGLIRPHR